MVVLALCLLLSDCDSVVVLALCLLLSDCDSVVVLAGSILHWSTRSWWTRVFLCRFRSELVWKPFEQKEQKWGRSPVWVYRCFRRWVDSLNLRAEHTKGN